MYNIIFYDTSPEVKDFLKKLEELKNKKDKNSRIEFAKINAYLNKLEEHGTALSFPFIRKLDNEIWELRPLKNRLLFAIIKDDSILILHYFIKTSRKTPKKELTKAKKNYKKVIQDDQLERGKRKTKS